MKALLLLALLMVSVAAAPAPKPRATTAPTRVRDGLVNGSIRFLVPADWELFDRGPNGTSVGYLLPEEKGRAVMLVTQQAEGIPLNDARVKKQMAKFVLEHDNEDLKNRKMEIIDAPKLEPDARFMIKVHERFKDGETTVDAVHFYRGIGLNLVSVTISANTDDKDEAKRIHDAGALMLLSVNLGPQDKRIIRPLPKKD
jgi:hypothetical protein